MQERDRRVNSQAEQLEYQAAQLQQQATHLEQLYAAAAEQAAVITDLATELQRLRARLGSAGDTAE